MASISSEPIAVIGMSCRFPAGADDPEKLWSLLAEGKSAWQDVPPDRFHWESFYHPDSDINGTTNHRGGHFFDQDIAAFDASFFGIPPSEAHAIDPQQRIQLETVFEGLENAGIALDQLKGSDTAVFVATFSNDYDRILYRDTSDITKYHMTGTGTAIASNRISYLLDLKGPSITLDTGCSGSLVALHQACQSLRSGESSIALVGATNMILSPDSMVPMSLLHILNGEGKCYPFDTRGSGYGRGEGAATIVLKRLDNAIQAGDSIRAVLRETGVNQDGKTAGITIPNQQSQQNLIRSVYLRAKLNPNETNYIEAHGTGTVAGDVTEFNSIIDCFCKNRDNPLYVGSIKSNIGHLESASGLAGLIKAILVLEKGFIPPMANFETIKQVIGPEDARLKIARNLEPFPSTSDKTRYASINSFGYGGTNAHVIIQTAPSNPWSTRKIKDGIDIGHVKAYPRIKSGETAISKHNKCGQTINQNLPSVSQKKSNPHLLVMTAKSEKSLLNVLANLAKWANDRSSKTCDLRNLSYTLTCRRTLMPWRYSMVANSYEDVMSLKSVTKRLERASPKVGITFLFTGQGAQWYAMGRELMFIRSEFENSLLRSQKILTAIGAPWDLVEELSREENFSRIQQSDIAQPSTTAIQIALVDLFHDLGILPTSVLGHSSGEIAAAYATGALSQAEALRVSFERGRLFNEARKSRGAMLAVGLAEKDAIEEIATVSDGTVCVACINSPNSTTISGDEDAITQLKDSLDGRSIFNRRLKVDVAYHSHHMLDFAERYLQSLHGTNCNATSASLKFYSSVTGDEMASDFTPSYWVQNLVSKVRYKDALEALCRAQVFNGELQSETISHAMIELGPHSALSGPTLQTLKQLDLERSKYSYVPTLVKDENSVTSVMRVVGKLFELGHGMNLAKINSLHGDLEPRSVVQDLPPYPWDHSCKYWHESHMSRDHRLRKHPYHDLIGHPVSNGISFGRHWRHKISIETLPWLRDHVIGGVITFPGAGYLCMAIQAALQIHQDHDPAAIVNEIILRDITFSKVLSLPDSSAMTEVQLSVVPSSTKTSKAATSWQDFCISSLSDGGARSDHCQGSVIIHTSSSLDTDQEIRERSLTAIEQRRIFEQRRTRCTQQIDPHTLYDELRSNGNTYGRYFAILEDVYISNSEVVGNAVIPDITACMPSGFMQPHIIHPTSLDALLHIVVPLLLRQSKIGSIMPVSLRRVAISAKVSAKPGVKLFITARSTPEGRRAATAEVLAFQSESGSDLSPVITISQEEIYATGQMTESDSQSSPGQSTVYQMQRGPDVDFLSKSALITARPMRCLEDQCKTLELKDLALERLTASYIRRCLDRIKGQGLNDSKNHMQHLLRWMRQYMDSLANRTDLIDMRTTDSPETQSGMRGWGVEGEALSKIGDRLPSILTGTIDALSLLLDDGLLYRLYLDDSSLQCSAYLSEYVKHLIFKKPYMNILEIGAGTAGTTFPLLQSLGAKKPTIRRYDYTDITPGFFESARTKLSDWSELLFFKTLDIERDPLEQGFEESSYDLIIASNVLHATKSIRETLLNVRRLLKPGGRLALIEVTRLVPMYNIIFGLLPGWWRGIDDKRQDCPLLSVDEWDKALSSTSFSGVDIATRDYEGPAGKTTMMVTSAVNREEALQLAGIDLMVGPTIGPMGQSFATSLAGVFKERGIQPTIKSRPWYHSSEDVVYVILDSNERPMLANIDREDFDRMIHLMIQAKKVLWVSLQENQSQTRPPGGGIAMGFGRTARSENVDLKFVTFDVQQHIGSNMSLILRTVCDIVDTSFGKKDASGTSETDFFYQEDELLIQRLVPDAEISSHMEVATTGSRKTELSPFHQPHRPLKLVIRHPGLLDSLIFIDDESALESLGDDELQIRVMACGINFKDVFVALGQMKGSTQMAGECSGIVTNVGLNMRTRFQPGDRVCAWNGTPYASRARVNGNATQKLPGSMSFAIGASIPVVFSTAYYSLVEIAKLQREHVILIHAASGGVGQAAIMIAQYIGAEIFATAGSEAKREFITEKYNIPETNVLSSKSSSLKNSIMRLTEGRGVNVILNSLSGTALEESWGCIAKFGTFVEIGKTDIYQRSQISMEPFDLNTTFASVDMVAVATHLPKKMNVILATVMSMFASGALHAIEPTTVQPMTEIESAFREIQGRRHTGKLVLEAGDGIEVKCVRPLPIPLRLNGTASYIVAGGLGSVGQSICRMMAERGAKHIVIVSRKFLETSKQSLFESDLASYGAKVDVILCDISDLNESRKFAFWCEEHKLQVKGIVQAAMVLQDRPVEQMTAAEFKAALKPKVDGTENLLSVFQHIDLSFFIMLSSAAGLVGSKGQSNYVAACSFQDAVAHTKPKSRTFCLSLNIGMVDESDTIASHGKRRKNLVRNGLIPLKLPHILALVEYAMSEQPGRDGKEQLAIGFSRQSLPFSLLQNNMFSHLPYENDKDTETQTCDKAISVGDAISTAANMDEAFNIVAGAMIKQLSALVAIDPDAVSLDSPIGDFGLDSLIAIEFKNWISQTLHAALQVSEIVDAIDFRQVLNTVIERSSLVVAYQQSQSGEGSQGEIGKSSSQSFAKGPASTTTSRNLPANPLPNLQDTLQLYFDSVRPFLDEDSSRITLHAIEDFKKAESLGTELQNRLFGRASDPQVDNWLFDLYNASRYLGVQAPVNPFQHFFGSHFESDFAHSQAERAAIVSVTAFQFKQNLESGNVKPDRLNDQDLCMNSLNWLFNSVREPQTGLDQMKKYRSHDYLVVLRRGRFYRVQLMNEPESSPYRRLRAIFQDILEIDRDPAPSVASLTADYRDKWSKVRKIVQTVKPSNLTLIEVIEKAAFIICLDDGSPKSTSERTNQFLLGDPSTRWSDKALQFVICNNGASAHICDHAAVDGGTLLQLGQHINRAIAEYKKDSIETEVGSPLNPDKCQSEEFIFTSNPEIEENIRRVKKVFRSTHPPVEYECYLIPTLGGLFFRAHKCAPNAGYSLIIQLASLQYFGFLPPCFETVSLRTFYKGRVDILQNVLPPVAEFCTAMLNPAIPVDSRRALFHKAAKAHSITLTRIGRGRGFGAHLRALREVIRDNEEVPLLFRDPAYAIVTKPEKLRTSCIPVHDTYPEAGFFQPEPVEIVVTYDIRNESCRISIQGPVGKTAKFFSLIEAAAEEVRHLLET